MKFDPDRMFDKEQEKRMLFFGGTGPRNCLGAKFAELEMKCVLAMLVRRFRIRLDTSVKSTDTLNFIWSTQPGVFVFLDPR